LPLSAGVGVEIVVGGTYSAETLRSLGIVPIPCSTL
jgi:hypothetical protein